MSDELNYIIAKPEQMHFISAVVDSELQKGPVMITIGKPTNRRSDAQNRLLWMWNNLIQKHLAEHTGQLASAEEWHDILVAKLLPAEYSKVRLPTGEQFKVGRTRTSRLSVKEMAEYMNLLEAYCAEYLNLILPQPDDYRFAVYGERQQLSKAG